MDLKPKQRVKVLLDQLSHGNNMTSCLVEYEVVRVNATTLSNSDVELDVELAIVRVVYAVEVAWGRPNKPVAVPGNWGNVKDLVGELEVLVRVVGSARWQHTVSLGAVDFVE